MRFIAHVFSIGRVGLYCSYKPQSRLIFLNINLLRLELCVAETQWRFLAGLMQGMNLMLKYIRYNMFHLSICVI